MTPFERLVRETAPAKNRFREIQVIARCLAEGVPADLYVAYLGQAYHHVRHTCPLLGAALARCGPGDERLAAALRDYIDEEEGHEAWILDDIQTLAGETAVARVLAYEGDPPVRALVAFMYDAIARRGPHAMLGMVHVLEGVSVELAERAVAAISERLGEVPGAGFSYMTSHGALDREHVAFFRTLVDGIADREAVDLIIDTANMVYDLWGRMFDELDRNFRGSSHAA
jgi:pyrroloquinoline quinone (PQQ) biosynthesis protein C